MSIDQIFPRLSQSGYQETSPRDAQYNCIAWAAQDQDRWWWPVQSPLSYWPQDVPRQVTIESFVQAFSALGYVECETANIEPGFEKLAFYVDQNNRPKHAARQLASGKWTSKIGKDIDIEHELEGLTGRTYGNVSVFMKRPLKASIKPKYSLDITRIIPSFLRRLIGSFSK